MDVSKLLLVGAAAMAATSANATIKDGRRVKPTPTKSALEYGKPYYLFNIGSEKYFLGANDWSTRASIGSKGFVVWINKHLEDGNWDGRTITLTDSCESKNGNKLLTWAAGGGDAWVDNAGQADSLWTLKSAGSNVYQFAASDKNPSFQSAAGQYFGSKKDNSDSKLWWNLSEEEGNTDWCFVTAENVDAYTEALKVFAAAENLYKVYEEAKELGVSSTTTNAALTLYKNEKATIEQIEAQVQKLQEAISAVQEKNTTAAKPVDKTTLIVNPSYEKNNNDGWNANPKPNNVAFTAAEFFQLAIDENQKISGAPKGVYALSLQGYYRAGGASESYDNYLNNTQNDAHMYVVAGEDTVTNNLKNIFADALETRLDSNTGSTSESQVTTADNRTLWVPNNMEYAAKYFEKGLYNNKLFFSTDDGEMTIGVKKANGDKPANNWTIMDNWGLTYYGNGADAYQLWLDDVKKQAKDYSTLPKTTGVTVGMVDAYNKKIATLTKATNKAQVLAAIKTIAEETAKVDENIAAWKAFDQIYATAKNTATNPNLYDSEYKLDLGDYVDSDMASVKKLRKATTAQVLEYVATLTKMNDDAIRKSIKPGTDVTSMFMKNADFSDKEEGWTVEKASGGNVAHGGPETNLCFEAWDNSKFDVHQVVKEAPRGVYTVSVKGFYRYGRGQNAFDEYQKAFTENRLEELNSAVSIYVNNNSSHFKNVFDAQFKYAGNHTGEVLQWTKENSPYITPDSTFWYPNDMINGGLAFAIGQNQYRTETYGIVANDGDELRIGVRGATNQLNDSWAIWDNFNMRFEGTKPYIIRPLLVSEVAPKSNSGVDPLGKFGVALKELKDAKLQLAGAELVTRGDEAVTAAKKEIERTKGVEAAKPTYTMSDEDGKQMFAVLSDIVAIKGEILQSKEHFESLNAAVNELSAALYKYKTTAEKSAYSSAKTLSENINNGLQSKSLSDEEAVQYTTEAKEAVQKLALSSVGQASDAHPADLTNIFVKSASFSDEDETTNSIEGWETSGSSFGNDGNQMAALALEFFNKTFDIRQKITDLPKGRYRVSINAFERKGELPNDKTSYNNGELTDAVLFAETANGTASVNLAHLSEGARVNKGFIGSWVDFGDGLSVPNDMVAANAAFDDPENQSFNKSVIVDVTDGTLTIGVKKEQKLEKSWVIMDDFKLEYFGENSKQPLTPTGIETLKSEALVGKMEIFSVTGAKKAHLTKGVNVVKTTFVDGSVSVKKVIVK